MTELEQQRLVKQHLAIIQRGEEVTVPLGWAFRCQSLRSGWLAITVSRT